MANVAKQEKLFDNVLHKHKYKIDDLVGLKIDKVDRTNFSPKVLLFKVISVESSADQLHTYQLCTTTCVIFLPLQALDLLDVSNCNFRDLRDVDSGNLPTMTFIQAFKTYVSIGFVTPVEVCNCSGTCSTKKCPCCRPKVQCGTKYHSKKPCSKV